MTLAQQKAEQNRLRRHELETFIASEPQDDREITAIPILHNKNVVYLQFHGWSVNLYNDGTWIVEDTTGG